MHQTTATPPISMPRVSAARRTHRPGDIALDDIEATDSLIAGVSPPRVDTDHTSQRPRAGEQPTGRFCSVDDDRESLELELDMDEPRRV